MLLDGRRVCDRCKSEIPSGTYWFMLVHTSEELCSACMACIHKRNEIPRSAIMDTLGDNGIRVFIDPDD